MDDLEKCPFLSIMGHIQRPPPPYVTLSDKTAPFYWGSEAGSLPSTSSLPGFYDNTLFIVLQTA